MRGVDEIPTEPYAEIAHAARRGRARSGARGENGIDAPTLIAELGIDPPD